MSEAVNFLSTSWREILTLAGEHLRIVLLATGAAVAIGIPTGILLTRYERFKRPVLALANVLQTIPSLALFGLLIPLPFIGGIGARTAVVALVVYALLPIIRNTVTGIEGVDPSVREAAVGMGMRDRQILWQVELPLAMSVILAGVRVAMVISVGVATIAAAIGAGGLGTYIFRGLRMNDNRLILAGAIPAALMALMADWALGLIEAKTGPERRVELTSEEKTRARLRRLSLAALAAVMALAIFPIIYLLRKPGVEIAAGGDRTPIGRIVVGSKDFTEQVILGELLAQALEAEGFEVERRFELGGNLAHDALIAGQIDCYPEYTGTSFTAILHRQPVSDARLVYEEVRREYGGRFGVEVSAPLGFRNDFAILVRGSDARKLSLRNISDAAPHAPGWRAGFGQDFMSRPDGYPGFARAYDLRFAGPPREMDLSLTYRALASGRVDIIAGNSTDGLIAALDLVQLEDDRHYFPPYEAVVLFRHATLERFPAARRAMTQIEGVISTDEMRRLNYEVDGKKRAVRDVVGEWRGRRAKRKRQEGR